VSIEGPGVSVSRDVNDEQAAAILNIILRPASVSSTRVHAGAARGGGGEGEPGSLAGFFRDVGARRNPDKIVTIAHYMKSVEGRDLLPPDDIRARFKEVGEAPPGNFNRDLRWAKDNGWIALDAETGHYYVTASGSAAVEARFSDDVTKKTTIRPRRRASRRATLSEPNEA